MKCKICGNKVGFISWLLDKLFYGVSHKCVNIKEIIKLNAITDKTLIKDSISIVPEATKDFKFLSERDKVLDKKPKIEITVSNDNDVLFSVYSYDNCCDEIQYSCAFLSKKDIDKVIDALITVKNHIG